MVGGFLVDEVLGMTFGMDFWSFDGFLELWGWFMVLMFEDFESIGLLNIDGRLKLVSHYFRYVGS